MAYSTPTRTSHSLILTSPGQGTVAELREILDEKGDAPGYHYIATDTWRGIYPVGRLDFLTDGNNSTLKENRVLIIDGFDLLTEEERLRVIRLFKLWMRDHAEQELTVKWVLYSFNEARVLEITGELFPLVAGVWEISK